MAAGATDRMEDREQPRLVTHDPGQLPAPDVNGQPKRIFSFAEASGRRKTAAEVSRTTLVNWGGTKGFAPGEPARSRKQGDAAPRRPRGNRLCPGRECSGGGKDAALRDAVISVVPAFGRGRPAADCTTMKKASRAFTDVDTWVFDLGQNALSAHAICGSSRRADRRVSRYLAKGSAGGSAPDPEGLYRRYGTTMRGMMPEHGVRATIILPCAPDRSAPLSRTGDVGEAT